MLLEKKMFLEKCNYICTGKFSPNVAAKEILPSQSPKQVSFDEVTVTTGASILLTPNTNFVELNSFLIMKVEKGECAY